ncbi:hypothetical protein Tco_0961223 [Tanacetum coccineum]
MTSPKASISKPSKKPKFTIIPPKQLFIDLTNEDTITPSPKLHELTPSAPNAPSKTISTKDTSSSSLDYTLFTKKKDSNLIIVQIYVDNIIFGSTCQEICNDFAKSMLDEFEMSYVPEEDLEEDDDEDTEEDPADYPTDRGDDGDDKDESSDDDEDDDVDIEGDEEEEEHPAPADSTGVGYHLHNLSYVVKMD